MPTAVMMESSEKTASRSRIWAMTTQKPALPLPCFSECGNASRRSCSSVVALKSRKRPPPRRIRSLNENGCPQTEKTGSVRATSHDMMERRPT